MRSDILKIEKQTREMREFIRDGYLYVESVSPDNQSEMMAHSMLSIRHLEDARMRLGKVMQYADGGVSIYDK